MLDVEFRWITDECCDYVTSCEGMLDDKLSASS